MTNVTNQELAFQDLISSAHAAIYSYGIIAAFSGNQDLALDHLAIHRRMRDQLIAAAVKADVEVSPAKIAYELPITVDTPTTAAACAATIEESMCAHWSQSIPYLNTEFKNVGISFAQNCALRAFSWSGVSKAFFA